MKTNKILLTLLFFAGAIGLANAQCNASFYFNSGPYSVGDTIVFNDSSAAPSGASYSWAFGDGSYGSTAGTTMHSYTSPGTYLVCLTIMDSSRMCFDTYCDSVVVNGVGGTSCRARFSSSSRGLTSYFYNNSSSVSGATYTWIYGDGNSSNNSSYSHSHTYASAGRYKVTLIQTTSSCADTTWDSVYVSGSTPCKAGFTSYVDSLDSCKIIFVSTSTGTNSSTSYYWSFGDGNTGSGLYTSHSYNTSGWVQVCLTISDSLRNCYDTYCDSIYVTPCSSGNPSCKAKFSSFMRGNTAYFYNQSNNISGATYTWIYGDGNSSNNGSYSHTHTYASSGRYKVTLIQTTSTCADTTWDSVYVAGSAPCSASFYSFADSIDTCKTVFVSTSTGTNASTMYSWSFGDGNSGSGQYASHSYSQSGWVVVCLTISDSLRNCYDTYCDSVYVKGCKPVGNKCTSTISGQIFVGRGFGTSGTVFLIEKRGNNLFLIDTTYIDSLGYYYFSKICKGDYYVKVALNKADLNYTDYLPTYYGDELKWDKASTVTVPGSKSAVDIQMIKGTNLGGPGFISGNVKKGANKKDGEPLGGVAIMVLDKDLEAVAYVVSKADGSFELPGLAHGKYQVAVDVPGMPVNDFWVELKEGDDQARVIVEVHSDEVELRLDGFVGIEAIAPLNNSFSVYPNPAGASFNLDIEGFAGTVELFDIAGKSVLTTSVNDNSNAINIDMLPAGWYQVRINGVQNDVPVLGTSAVVKR